MREITMDNSGIKYLILIELFSPDPYSECEPWLTEEEQERCYQRWKESQKDHEDWKYIFEGVQKGEKLVELLEGLNKL